MTSILKAGLALFVAAFISSPALAADVATPATPATPAVETPAKPDMGSILKGKASDALEKGKQKVDNAADNLQKSLGLDKAKDAQAKAGEAVDVTQETVTVETPQGAAQETTITVAPADGAQAAPEAAQPK